MNSTERKALCTEPSFLCIGFITKIQKEGTIMAFMDGCESKFRTPVSEDRVCVESVTKS